MTSGLEAKGRFGKQDFVYLSDEDAYRCPAGEKLTYHYTNEEDGRQLRRYWTNACRNCALKANCTTGKERRITRWEHEHVLEEAQRRLDNNPQAMRQRRETVEHPFGTMKARMGATHFLTKTLPKVAAEMVLSVLAYNLTRVIDVMFGDRPVLSPAEIFYQRMLAGDPTEATEKAEEFLKERSLSSYYDDVAIKGLQLAQADLDRDTLDQIRLVRIRDTVLEFVNDLSDQTDQEPTGDRPTADAEAAAAVDSAAGVPIIMITAYGDAETKRRAIENGAEALLTKPIDFGTLRSEIDSRVMRAA
jgi:CheY-like chemotaxis protein